MTQPIYRDDVKGSLVGIKNDFVFALKSELRNSDTFLLCVEDAGSYEEYAKYLTDDELQACWRKANGMKRSAIAPTDNG